jgi:cardiolipin synthase A/B
MISTAWVIALGFLQILAIAFAFHAIKTARTPQGAVGWVIFLIAAPYLGIPSYLFLGHSKFRGIIAARRASERAVPDLEALWDRPSQEPINETTSISPDLKALERLAEMPICDGNTYQILIDGTSAFDAIFKAISEAENYILLQSYIIRDDGLGQVLKDLLVRRASDGLKVKVLYDAIGSANLSSTFIRQLRKAGAEVYDFHALWRFAHRFQLNFRNHRKILICDGKIGFVGGINFAEEYLGRDPKLGGWRDTHLRLDGPAVQQLQLAFVTDWNWATKKIPDLDWKGQQFKAGTKSLIVATGPGGSLETGSLFFATMIAMAKKRLWIASPYFVPDIDLCTSLKLAALKGIDVRILVPDKADNLLVELAGYAYFDELIEVGIRFYRYKQGFMHQKVILVDDTVAGIGTHNLDVRSCRLNFEITALLFGQKPANQVVEMLEKDFACSEPDDTSLSERPLLKRVGAPIARLFAPLL